MAKVFLSLAVLLCGLFIAEAQRVCDAPSIKVCWKSFKDFKHENKGKDFTAEMLDKKCKILSEVKECLSAFKDVCERAGKWEDMKSAGKGFKSMMTEICNNTEVKNEFVKHLPCFNENKQAVKDCMHAFKPEKKPGVEHTEADLKDKDFKKGCCIGKAAAYCKKEVLAVKCPDSKALMEKLAAKLMESKEFCETKGFLDQCVKRQTTTTAAPSS